MKSIKSDSVSPVPSGDLPPATPNPEAQKARCYDKEWEYTPSGSTDLRAVFRRIKRQLKDNEAALHKAATTVCELKRKAKP